MRHSWTRDILEGTPLEHRTELVTTGGGHTCGAVVVVIFIESVLKPPDGSSVVSVPAVRQSFVVVRLVVACDAPAAF